MLEHSAYFLGKNLKINFLRVSRLTRSDEMIFDIGFGANFILRWSKSSCLKIKSTSDSSTRGLQTSP